MFFTGLGRSLCAGALGQPACVPHRHAPPFFRREGDPLSPGPQKPARVLTDFWGTGPASPATLTGVSDGGTARSVRPFCGAGMKKRVRDWFCWRIRDGRPRADVVPCPSPWPSPRNAGRGDGCAAAVRRSAFSPPAGRRSRQGDEGRPPDPLTNKIYDLGPAGQDRDSVTSPTRGEGGWRGAVSPLPLWERKQFQHLSVS